MWLTDMVADLATRLQNHVLLPAKTFLKYFWSFLPGRPKVWSYNQLTKICAAPSPVI